MNPDSRRELKLALLLVATASMLVAGSGTAAMSVLLTFVADGFSPLRFAMLGLLRNFGGILVVFAAIWVDRRGPLPLITIGATTAAAGFFLISISSHQSVFGAGLFIAGIGGAGTAWLVFYALAARGTIAHRGALLAILTVVFTGIPATPLFSLLAASVSASMFAAAALSLAAAFLLYRYLPQFPLTTPPPDPTHPGTQQLFAQPSTRRALISLGLVFMAARAIQGVSAPLFPKLWVDQLESPNIEFLLTAMGLANVIGILAWGITSDRIPAHRLLLIAGLIGMPLLGIAWLVDTPAISNAAWVAFSFSKSAFLVLPWVLLAEHLPTHRFATLGWTLGFVGGFAAFPASIVADLTLGAWGLGVPATMLIALSLLAVAAAWRFPTSHVPQPVD